MTSLTRFKLSRRGVTGVEYGMLLALIAAVIIVPVISLGGGTEQIFCNMGGAIGGAACPDASAAFTTPGAGETPLQGMAALPAGTVCTNSPAGGTFYYGETAAYIRSCVEPSGTLYSATAVSYNTTTGTVDAQTFVGSNVTVGPSTSTVTSGGVTSSTGNANTGSMIYIDGDPANGTGQFYTTSGYFFQNAAQLSSEGMTLYDEQQNDESDTGPGTAFATPTASLNAAAAYMLGSSSAPPAGAPADTGGGFIAVPNLQ